ncbi:MAG: hypothetical protein PHI90_10900, partial [Clostridia bacterium]|nr:hypothetical protein [Clostridia bacterium]
MNRKTNWKKAGILLAMLVFCVSSILISTISVEAAKSPIAYWKLSENGETQVKDYSGNGKDGNIRGLAAWINGIKGKAINLLVSSSYIETTPSILEKGTWSYETWVRPGLTVGEACIYTEK